jgi:hypothetical protein
VRAQALEVAAGWSLLGAPRSWQLTAALFRAIAGHEELVAALAELPPDRLPALLASAAITYLVRRDRPARLARYFPDPGGPEAPFASGFHALAMAFISERIADIMALCRDRGRAASSGAAVPRKLDICPDRPDSSRDLTALRGRFHRFGRGYVLVRPGSGLQRA